ncbi:hypothetical protein [uncultured Hymenobacter sp.]|uniref:hypothetical protein n=1 Tax=uncultured Hymenobacter sp. TaxID=170016 RepID=UPI0035C96323
MEGKEGASAVLKTSGPPVALRLTADHTKLTADGQNLSFVFIELVYQQGNVVYDSNRQVAISQSGGKYSLIPARMPICVCGPHQWVYTH